MKLHEHSKHGNSDCPRNQIVAALLHNEEISPVWAILFPTTHTPVPFLRDFKMGHLWVEAVEFQMLECVMPCDDFLEANDNWTTPIRVATTHIQEMTASTKQSQSNSVDVAISKLHPTFHDHWNSLQCCSKHFRFATSSHSLVPVIQTFQICYKFTFTGSCQAEERKRQGEEEWEIKQEAFHSCAFVWTK